MISIANELQNELLYKCTKIIIYIYMNYFDIHNSKTSKVNKKCLHTLYR